MSSQFFEDEKSGTDQQAVSMRVAFRGLWPYLAKHRLGLIYCLVILAVATIGSLYWPVLLKRAMDVDIANKDMNGLALTVVIIALIQILTLVLQYVQRIKLERIGQDVMIDLKERMFDHILSLDVSFFDKNPVGRLMARVESDTEALRMLFTNTVVMIVGDVLLVSGILAVMFWYSWRLALIVTFMGPVIITMIYFYVRLTEPRWLEVRKRMAEVTASLTEFLYGMSIVQIFHRAKYAQGRVNEASHQKFKAEMYGHMASVVLFNAVSMVQYWGMAGVLFFGALWIADGSVTVGTISMFIILIWRSFEPIHRASEQLGTIQKGLAGGKRIFALLSERPTIIETVAPRRWARLEQGIRFENVWFSYTNDENYALKDVTFEIPVGKRVALVGVTGGGKTSVISLLLRMYDPQKGRITVDGIDVREISQADLRKRFALVLQDIILFPGHVASNISLDAEEVSSDMVLEASRQVEADRFIQRLPSQYQTEVSEKGANFSRGERQLLSFARALVKNPDVLLLDEATSSVDPETERTIQASLKMLWRGRTSLVIAHRLSTILDVDQILVIRRGEIIERGTHTELILADGYYSKLFHLQFKNRSGAANNA